MRLPLHAFQKILDEVKMKANVLKVSLVALGLCALKKERMYPGGTEGE